ncbi:MAG: IPT/TIG domain-containing protein [Bryobacteraceae bacterium]
MTVYGDNLIDFFNQTATPAINPGSGITLTPTSASATQVTLNYSIATNASTGKQNLTLTTTFGTSNAASFNIGDPTPNITSVNPNQWPAGATTAITITGTGFGTNPTLSIDATGITGLQIMSSSDTQITAQVTIDPSAPDQPNVTLTVTSQGYGGSGFLSTNPGQPSQGTNSQANIVAATPQILWGTACGSATQIGASMNVVAGQAITLVACMPGNTAVANPSWQLPQNVWITGGYAAGTTTGGQEAPDPLTDQSTLMFYFVDSGGSWPVTVSTGQRTASVTFAVTGPSSVSINAPLKGVNILPTNPPTLALGTPPTSAGIQFTVSATPPAGNAGTYSWVQLIKSDQYTLLTGTGSVQNCVPTTFATDPSPELDNVYPYATGVTTNDSPSASLPDPMGEIQRAFQATMYLMWIPSPAGNCSGTIACAVPVPLGTVGWQFCGDAINTLAPQSNSTTWLLNCSTSTPSPAPYQASTAYPEWTPGEKYVNGAGSTCHQ